jgi:tryptophan 2,3-dioxygenase
MLGMKKALMLEPHRHREDLLVPLERLLNEPSLYDESIRLLARRGFAIGAGALERDWSRPREFDATVCDAWVGVYRGTAAHWDLYELAEKLVDIEDAFRQWRFRHATTVERIIGWKRGTGGTSGVGYLKAMLDQVLFPELWRARTAL